MQLSDRLLHIGLGWEGSDFPTEPLWRLSQYRVDFRQRITPPLSDAGQEGFYACAWGLIVRDLLATTDFLGSCVHTFGRPLIDLCGMASCDVVLSFPKRSPMVQCLLMQLRTTLEGVTVILSLRWHVRHDASSKSRAMSALTCLLTVS